MSILNELKPVLNGERITKDAILKSVRSLRTMDYAKMGLGPFHEDVVKLTVDGLKEAGFRAAGTPTLLTLLATVESFLVDMVIDGDLISYPVVLKDKIVPVYAIPETDTPKGKVVIV